MANSSAVPTMSNPRLPNIDEVEPYSDKDKSCFEDLQAVLKKHHALSRFGITLLHEHFDVSDDELLVESCDIKNRTLVIQPVKKSALEGEEITETNWQLDENPKVLMGCRQVCLPRQEGHVTDHVIIRA